MGTVVVQVEWADADRGERRTLRVDATSLDEVSRAIGAALGDAVANASANCVADDAAATTSAARVGVPVGLRTPRRDREPATRRTARLRSKPVVPPSSPADPNPNGRLPSPMLNGTDASTMGSILWAIEAPAGRFLPAATLVQVQLNDRRVLLRIPGSQHFEAGKLVSLDGECDGGNLFDADLSPGAVSRVTFRLKERLL